MLQTKGFIFNWIITVEVSSYQLQIQNGYLLLEVDKRKNLLLENLLLFSAYLILQNCYDFVIRKNYIIKPMKRKINLKLVFMKFK